MSDRIAVMDVGDIRQIGTPSEIYHRPTSRFVAEFMGEANILPARNLTYRGDRNVDVAGLAMIRAESFFLDAADVGEDAVVITGRLSAKAFRGENWLLSLEGEDGAPIMLSVPATRAASCGDMHPGQIVTAYAQAEAVHAMPQRSAG